MSLRTGVIFGLCLGLLTGRALAGEPVSDDFDKPASRANWQRVMETEKTGANQLERLDWATSKPGWAVMEPYASVWYQDWRGVLVYQEATGDFVATTHVVVTNRKGDGAPRASFSLAGIMVRQPREVTPATWKPGGENYIFLSLGSATHPGRYQFEDKVTQNSRSKLVVSDAPGKEAWIRVARIGGSFILLRKAPGEAWVVHKRFEMPRFARTMQVGMCCYTDWNSSKQLPPARHNVTVIKDGHPDLVAAFDYFHFAKPKIPDALAGKSLAGVSDAELLAFLAED